MANTTALDRIHAIPGLYISDRFSARDQPLLARHRISHILSVLRWEDLQSNRTPQSSSTAQDITGPVIQRKQVEINDDETEDIVGRLTEMTDWIRDALTKPHPYENANQESTGNGSWGHTGGCVLVHCNQGISRSGTVVVAYIMKSLSIPFVPALSLARVSRSLITPNNGFEYQLWLWERHGYDVFDRRVNGSNVTLVPNEAYGKFLDEVNDIFSFADEERILLAKTYWSAEIKAKLIDLRRG